MLDGFVLGTGLLYFIIGSNEAQKRALINSVGPVWNGNEVWLITAGGATFAAFPFDLCSHVQLPVYCPSLFAGFPDYQGGVP